MVADPPRDERPFLDPDTLIFAFTPVEDPLQYRSVWQGFLEYMETKTGREVEFYPIQSTATQIEAMRAGRLHVAGFNTGSVPLAVNCAGFRPVAMMGNEQGEFGYKMEIVVRADSSFQSVEDLVGHSFAFTSPTSNSGYKAPTTILHREFGIEPEEDFETSFSGNHENSIINVSLGDYDGAAVASIVANRVYQGDDTGVSRDDIRVLYRSQTFPTTGFGYAHDLEPELARAIRESFLSFDWEGTDLTEEFEDETQFIPIDYRKHWKVIRQIDEQFGEDYSCR